MNSLRRMGLDLLSALATLVCVIALCLALLRMVPGGPFASEKAAPPEVQAALAERYGLDRAYLQQLGDYLLGVARGDFGPSFQQVDFSVGELIGQALPITLTLGVSALLLSLLLAALSAWLAAAQAARFPDRVLAVMSLAAQAMPKFVLAPLLVLWLAILWRWLPATSYDQGWQGWILPVLSLAIPQWAWLHRIARSALLETQASTAWRAASGRGRSLHQRWLGLGGRLLWPRLLNAAQPAAIALLTGSAVVEQVFALPGLGRLLVESALNRDFTLLLGTVSVSTALVLAIGWLSQVLVRALDPRLRSA